MQENQERNPQKQGNRIKRYCAIASGLVILIALYSVVVSLFHTEQFVDPRLEAEYATLSYWNILFNEYFWEYSYPSLRKALSYVDILGVITTYPLLAVLLKALWGRGCQLWQMAICTMLLACAVHGLFWSLLAVSDFRSIREAAICIVNYHWVFCIIVCFVLLVLDLSNMRQIQSEQ